MLAYGWCCSGAELQSCDLFVFTMDARRIEVSLSQDKIGRINNIHQTQLKYWKDASLRDLDQNDADELEGLAHPSLLLIRKVAKYAKTTDINEITFYLK